MAGRSKACCLLVLAATYPHSAVAFQQIADVRPGCPRPWVCRPRGRKIQSPAPLPCTPAPPLRPGVRGRGAARNTGVEVTDVLLQSGLGGSVGFVLGLLGGGGGILALPIFLNVFQEPSSSAIPESLLVVAVGAGVALLAKLKDISLSEIAPLAACAALGI